jgi:hypothetical protein
MFKLGGKRSRSLPLLTGLTALAMLVVAFGSSAAVNAAPRGAAAPGVGKGAISNDLVEIAPAKVRGTYTDPDSGRSGRVVAKFVPQEFVADGDAIAVEGTLSGVFAGKLPKGQQRHFSETVTFDVVDATSPGEASTAGLSATGAATGGVAAAAPLAAPAAGCDVLNLVLGPLDLNLLGLQVDLSQVVLDIVAQPGAGNLLGNLLCAVAGLLDPGSALGGLLDNLLGALNGLLTGVLDLGSALEGLTGAIGGLGAAEAV